MFKWFKRDLDSIVSDFTNILNQLETHTEDQLAKADKFRIKAESFLLASRDARMVADKAASIANNVRKLLS
jgi:hypothetical protein